MGVLASPIVAPGGMALSAGLDTIGDGLANRHPPKTPACITFATAAIAAKVTLAYQFGTAGITWRTVLRCALIQILPHVYLPNFPGSCDVGR